MTAGAFSLKPNGRWELNDQGLWKLKCACWYVAAICAGPECPPGGSLVQVPCPEVEAHRNSPGDIFFKFGGGCYSVSVNSPQVDTVNYPVANLKDSAYEDCEECCEPISDCPTSDEVDIACPAVLMAMGDITLRNDDAFLFLCMFPGEEETLTCERELFKVAGLASWISEECGLIDGQGGLPGCPDCYLDDAQFGDEIHIAQLSAFCTDAYFQPGEPHWVAGLNVDCNGISGDFYAFDLGPVTAGPNCPAGGGALVHESPSNALTYVSGGVIVS